MPAEVSPVPAPISAALDRLLRSAVTALCSLRAYDVNIGYTELLETPSLAQGTNPHWIAPHKFMPMPGVHRELRASGIAREWRWLAF